MTEDREAIDRFWREEPEVFSRAYRPTLHPVRLFKHAFLRQRCARALYHLAPTKESSIADVGCGSGVLLAALAERANRVVGFDVSAAMLAQAAARRLPDNASLVQSDCSPIPCRDRCFDAVACIGVLGYIADVAGFVGELARVTRPGGRIVLTSPKRPSLFAPLRWFAGLRRSVAELPPAVTILDRSRLCGVLESAGLELRDLSSLWTTMWIARVDRPA